MASGDILIYNSGMMVLQQKKVDLANDDLRVILVWGYTPDRDNHSLYAHVSSYEFGTGGGYVAGGELLTSQTLTQDDPNDRTIFGADPTTWDPLDLATVPSHAIVYSDTASNDELLFCIECGKKTTGAAFTLYWDGIGIMTMEQI